MPNPHANPAASQSRFPFASRLSRQDPQAPLFYSATNDFHDEDDGDEHEREAAAFYALQRSRQHFGPSNLTDSSEVDNDAIERLQEQPEDQVRERDGSTQRGRTRASRNPFDRDGSEPDTDISSPSSKGKGRLVDINLASTINEEPPESLADLQESEDRPAPFQTFRTPVRDFKHSSFMPQETDEEALIGMPSPPSPDRESVPPTVILPAQEPPKHDAFWAQLYKISVFAMFGGYVLIWFHTSTPSSKNPLGDTIYSALSSSTNMLLWDTMIAIIVACIWLSLLRHYVRGLVYTLIIAVPVILFSFALYPLISSFQGAYHGKSFQDRAMRWLSFIPALMAVFWTFSVIKSRHSLAKSIGILEFSTKILTASPYLVILGFGTLAVTVLFTWVWMLMFERIFLSGSFTGAKKFLIDANSWWLGAFFVLQYLWSLGVIAGVQRTTTAATVSQWYFHRFAENQPTSEQVVKASFMHSIGALLGSVCLSTFLSLLVRLPLIILPGKLSGLLNMCAFALIPSSLATLTNPLTLTYAAVHSQPLGISARNLGTLNFVSRTNPSNTLNPRNFSPVGNPSSSLMPYRLSKLLLQATRWVMSFALGFGGWVRTAHHLKVAGTDAGIRGSLYAYVVGLIAGTIGFAVLGAIENVVGAVLDAAVVCWASETAGGRGEARYCREAGEMFGDDVF
jgi:flagellar biosynthesis protein FliQ